MEEQTKNREEQDSIKLSKNSKGYTWEIKRYYDFKAKNPDDVIKELDAMNKQLLSTFGGE